MPPDISVIICSLNGAAGVTRCLQALAAQTAVTRMEIIVVDDGSSDGTGDVAREHGATVVRHETNRGIAAARNSGVQAATAPIVAFLDDDCEPEPRWLENVLASYAPGVAGVGGPLLPKGCTGFMLGYLTRRNPLAPQELELAKSEHPLYRLHLYLQRQWSRTQPAGRRDVYAFAGANMSFRRQVIAAAGGFDERFQFGAEEVDFCLRLARTSPPARLVFVPEARVWHYFEPTLRDTLRRSHAYGLGSARLYRKWPSLSPTFFPGPVGVLATLMLSVWFPVLAAAVLLLPPALYARGVRDATARRKLSCLLDPYVQLAQEACEDLGFLQGCWRFRQLVPEPRRDTAPITAPGREVEHVP